MMSSRSNSDPLISSVLLDPLQLFFEHGLFRKPLHTFRDHALARTSPSSRRTLGVAVPTGSPLVHREPQCKKFRLGRSSSPANAFCLHLIGLQGADFPLQSPCRESTVIGTVILP